MKNFVQPGRVITLAAPYDVASGDGLLVGSIFGVATSTVAATKPVETELVGVFDLKSNSGGGTAIAAGAKVYWDNTAKVATGTSTSNTLIGAAVLAKLDAGATVRVRLNGTVS